MIYNYIDIRNDDLTMYTSAMLPTTNYSGQSIFFLQHFNEMFFLHAYEGIQIGYLFRYQKINCSSVNAFLPQKTVKHNFHC